jgi:hypothetical protein
VGGGKSTPGLATGLQGQEILETLSGLEQGKQYTVCLSVSNGKESTLSLPVKVTTAIAPETPEAASLKAEPIAVTTATLQGVLNPLAERKSEPGSYEFLYKRSATECEGESTTRSTGASGDKQEAVSAPIGGLLPHTTYTFCLREANEVGEAATSAPVTFTTLAAAPTIEESGASDVASTSATLSTTIDPEGAATSYTFEYAPAGGSFAPVAEAEGHGRLVEGVTGVVVSAHVQSGLLADTTYQFRVVAANSAGTLTGETVSFTTMTAGGGFELPDGRQWEMVSPPDKHGGDIEGVREAVVQAAEDGSAITYRSNGPLSAQPAANILANTQDISVRQPGGGWSTQDISTPHEAAVPVLSSIREYMAFSPDLTLALVQPAGETPLAPGVSGENAYLRNNATGQYQPLIKTNPEVVPPLFNGATPDLRHIVFASLTTALGGQRLQEWGDGGLVPVSVLPSSEGGGEEANCRGVGVGQQGTRIPDDNRNAISSDGKFVIWSMRERSDCLRGPALFLRDTAPGEEETLRLDLPQGVVPKGRPAPEYEIANVEDTRIFFADSQRLTADSTASEGENYESEGDLYECEVIRIAGKLACSLSDLTIDHNAGESARLQGTVLGASQDGSYIYFVASGVLTSEANSQGAHARPGPSSTNISGPSNIYVLHRQDGVWTTHFIANVSSEEEQEQLNGRGVGQTNLLHARVSPNGRFLAFMSGASLTGYENPDEEVYLYDAEGKGGAGNLICASCNPTGAPPIGVYDPPPGNGESPALLVDPERNMAGERLAGSIPTLTVGEGLYAMRNLFDSGRLFFDSSQALVPLDVNGKEDVYEYEPWGVGSCTSATSSGSVVQARETDGSPSGACVGLISSGTSSEESAFMDASANGDDAFFLTQERLTSQDHDNALDVYDAHVCSTAVPCVPVAAAPPPCISADACRAAPAPQPEVFGSPASATFSGQGNPASAPPAVLPKASTKRKAKPPKCSKLKGSKRALRACQRASKKAKRSIHRKGSK